MEEAQEALAAKFQAIFPHLDERQRRLLMGAEARALGHGGIRAVARAAGVREATVSLGVDELDSGADSLGRARRPGGGRKRAAVLDPGLRPVLLALVEPEERGDPVVSVDTKKKELVGEFKNAGREWRPKGQGAAATTRVADRLGQILAEPCPVPVGVGVGVGQVQAGADRDPHSDRAKAQIGQGLQAQRRTERTGGVPGHHDPVRSGHYPVRHAGRPALRGIEQHRHIPGNGDRAVGESADPGDQAQGPGRVLEVLAEDLGRIRYGRPVAPLAHERQLNYNGCRSEGSSGRSESLTDMACPWPQGDTRPASLAEQGTPVPSECLDKPVVRLVWLRSGDY